MILRENIFSTFNKGHQYGPVGEKVKLIATRGDVLIVEGKSGRFSVRKEKVITNN